jgi:outer membrane protein
MENENNTQINQPEMPENVNEIQPETKGKSCPFRPSTVINVILFIAIGVLYFLHFYSGKPANTAANISNGPLKVAYFDTDTVFQKYLLVEELRDGLKKSKDSLEGIFNSRQAAFEGKVRNYQNNLKNNAINATQAQNAETQLMKEREEIMQVNEIYTQQLVVKESEIQRRITEDIIAYANLFNKTYGADYILGYTKGGPIIVVNEKLDVTKDIIEGLNKEYKDKKGK